MCTALCAGAAVLMAVAGGRDVAVPSLSATRPTPAPDAGTTRPRCFGAAARDPAQQPCINPALRLTVMPSPSDAPLVPSSPCQPIRGHSPEVCAFGVPASHAVETVALVGDSHAVHWRAALDVVARARHWRGLTISMSSCPFTGATRRRPGSGASECKRWTRQAVRWLSRHPRVNTVFVSGSAILPIVPSHGESEFATKVAGYRAIWNALRPSVRHIVVLRDTPDDPASTMSCVEHAIARRIPAGPACARPRLFALPRDPATVAAAQSSSPRIAVIDLSDFMCDASLCYPVVGGVLVHRDEEHLTRLFSTTLGPFLLRAVNRLKRSQARDQPAPTSTTSCTRRRARIGCPRGGESGVRPM
jgi:hypothetical protein